MITNEDHEALKVTIKAKKEEELATGCFAALGAITFLPASIVLGAIVNGWVVMHLWAWFVVPLGVMQISLPWAIGFDAFWTLLCPKHSAWMTEKTKEEMTLWKCLKALYTPVLQALMFLAIGWVCHKFMA